MAFLPGQTITAASDLRPRLDWAEGKTGTVLVDRGKHVVVRVTADNGRTRIVVFRAPSQLGVVGVIRQDAIPHEEVVGLNTRFAIAADLSLPTESAVASMRLPARVSDAGLPTESAEVLVTPLVPTVKDTRTVGETSATKIPMAASMADAVTVGEAAVGAVPMKSQTTDSLSSTEDVTVTVA